MLERLSVSRGAEAPRGLARSTSVGDPPGRGPSAFSEVLEKLGREIDSGERLVERAVGGTRAGLAAGDLIALQAGIYRYTEAVDLSARLVDRASAAVKTTLGSSG